MDQSEGKLIFCENKKPIIDKTIPVTVNKKHISHGTFLMNLRPQEVDKKSTYGNMLMTWATHIKTVAGGGGVMLCGYMKDLLACEMGN